MTYSYLVLSPTGKEVKGTIDAESRELAARRLRHDGNTVLMLEEASVLSRDIAIPGLQKKPTSREMGVFCRQFVSIINAGVSVTAALEMLAEQTENKLFAAVINDCRVQIESGSSFSEAMQQHPDIFSHMFVTLVAAGEASGSLDVSFERMSIQFEKDAKLKGLIKRVATYPIVVLIVSLAVIAVMLAYVVPQYESFLADLGGELPALTKGVVAVSNFFVARWYVVVLVIGVLAVAFKYFQRTESGGLLLGRVMIKAPLIGKLTVKSASARMARTMSTLLGAGLPMIDSLEIVASTMTNVHFKNAMLSARDDVAMGESLGKSIQMAGMFPPLVYHMIGIGEETGDTEFMLEKLADYYEEEVELTTQQVMAAVEPMIIMVLALIVGLIVGAVMLPMVNMYDALDNL